MRKGRWSRLFLVDWQSSLLYLLCHLPLPNLSLSWVFWDVLPCQICQNGYKVINTAEGPWCSQAACLLGTPGGQQEQGKLTNTVVLVLTGTSRSNLFCEASQHHDASTGGHQYKGSETWCCLSEKLGVACQYIWYALALTTLSATQRIMSQHFSTAQCGPRSHVLIPKQSLPCGSLKQALVSVRSSPH